MPEPARERPGGIAILIVEDREADRRALVSLCTRPGLRVLAAATGEDALKVLLREEVAVILLDLRLPGMDGFELASLIKKRERTRHVPIIFMTAEGDDRSVVQRAYEVGAVDFLTKPLVPEVVRAKVEVFVDLMETREALRHQAELVQEAERMKVELQISDLRLAAARRYRQLAEAIPHIVWSADRSGAVEYFNQRWFEYTAISADQAKGNWLVAVHPEDLESTRDAWEAALRGTGPWERETRLRRADGDYRWHLCRAIPESNQSGTERVGWLCTCTDIDDQKRAVEERSRLYQEAQAAVQARDEFLSIASHELKTPLTTLTVQYAGMLRTLKRSPDGLPPEEMKRRLETAARQIERLSRLVDELLDITRLSAGLLHLEREEVDLREVVEDAVERMREGAARVGSTFSLTATEPVWGHWDRMRLEQVIANLLSNAVKYGAGEPVDVTVQGCDSTARLEVRDRGIGIPADMLEMIFERFERAASARQFGGLGLGLYISRQIVEAHGGSIWAQSQEGAGALLAIELPRRSAMEEGAPAVRDDDSSTARDGHRILRQ